MLNYSYFNERFNLKLINSDLSKGFSFIIRAKNENLNVEDLLSPVRQGDRGNDLWKIFNVVQEKLVKGGLVFNDKKEKMQKLRPITNIDRRIDVNKKLWELTEAYV